VCHRARAVPVHRRASFTPLLRFFRPDRSEVATDRSTPYFALSSGCIARVAFFTAFGVAVLLTARTG
jgi:hypothetical protein